MLDIIVSILFIFVGKSDRDTFCLLVCSPSARNIQTMSWATPELVASRSPSWIAGTKVLGASSAVL